jgi:Transposase DDE domain group 1
MPVQSTAAAFHFQTPSALSIEAAFDGGHISSDGGSLLLAEVERHTGVLARLAACFRDHRDPDLIEHTVPQLIAQRVYGIALGYEDLNDHDRLRFDPLLAALVGKDDPLGQSRARPEDRGKPLAGKSTLNRLELTPADAGPNARYQKVVHKPEAIEQLFVEVFLDAHATPPEEIILDLDATDDPLHGEQEGRFFHGYYDCYCYLPLYIFCGDHLLCAKLRTAEHGAAFGALEVLQRVVTQIRRVWPAVRILVRGDSDFGTEDIMAWCEGSQQVDYVFGLQSNSRLLETIGREMMWAHIGWLQTGVAWREWADFDYQTRKSWTRPRRVVAKAEYLPGGANPRFVVTSLAASTHPPQTLYEGSYCERGDTENRIKEQKLDLASGRTSTSKLRANQLRLWFSATAYVLVSGLRRLGLAGTPLARAQCGSLRQRLLKIGAWVRVTAQRVRVALTEAFPLRALFARACAALGRLPSWAGPQVVACPGG